MSKALEDGSIFIGGRGRGLNVTSLRKNAIIRQSLSSSSGQLYVGFVNFDKRFIGKSVIIKFVLVKLLIFLVLLFKVFSLVLVLLRLCGFTKNILNLN